MAEFQEIIKQFRRMCWYYQRQVKCDGCPMVGCNISQCRKLAFDRPDETEIIVTKWAAEHPEPQFPTFYDWLEKLMGSDRKLIVDDHDFVRWLDEHNIPANIAEKLGIKPKDE